MCWIISQGLRATPAHGATPTMTARCRAGCSIVCTQQSQRLPQVRVTGGAMVASGPGKEWAAAQARARTSGTMLMHWDAFSRRWSVVWPHVLHTGLLVGPDVLAHHPIVGLPDTHTRRVRQEESQYGQTWYYKSQHHGLNPVRRLATIHRYGTSAKNPSFDTICRRSYRISVCRRAAYEQLSAHTCHC